MEDDVSYLLQLPIELRERAMLELDVKDILSLCAVSKELKRSCDHDFFWKQKTHVDFPETRRVAFPPLGKSWKEVYIERSTKILKRVRFAVGAFEDARDMLDATTWTFNWHFKSEEDGEHVLWTDPESSYEILGTDGTEVYDLLEPKHAKLLEFYNTIEDLPVGYIREEALLWEGVDVTEAFEIIAPVNFRFVKTSEGEGYMEWTAYGDHFVIEFHQPEHDFGGVPITLLFAKKT